MMSLRSYNSSHEIVNCIFGAGEHLVGGSEYNALGALGSVPMALTIN